MQHAAATTHPGRNEAHIRQSQAPTATVRRCGRGRCIPDQGLSTLVFYGPGGTGKTALRREIEHRVQDDADTYGHLCMAVLDLHANPDISPEETIITLRNQFVRAGVSLPAFDIALALIWHRAFPARRLPPLEQGWLTNRAEDLGEAATELVDAFDIAVDAIPFAASLRKLAGFVVRKGREKWLATNRDWLRQFLAAEYESRPATELPALLPTLLAEELNHWRQQHPEKRFLLLVDEYEHCVPEAQPGRALHGNSPLDAAMRRFLSGIDGLLAVFFLRTRLPWEESEHWRQDLQDRQHLLEGLSEADARAWLAEAGITDAALQQAIMRGARESDAEDASIFALFLALQIEHHQALLNAGEQPAPEYFTTTDGPLEDRLRQMAARLLRDFRDDAMQQLVQRLARLSPAAG